MEGEGVGLVPHPRSMLQQNVVDVPVATVMRHHAVESAGSEDPVC
jgi:hypothetical protein